MRPPKDALESAERKERQIEMLEETITAYQKSSTRQGLIILTLAGVCVIFFVGLLFTTSVWEYENSRADALCLYTHSLERMNRELLDILNGYNEAYPDAESVPSLDCD